jgi:flagellar protein FliJ
MSRTHQLRMLVDLAQERTDAAAAVFGRQAREARQVQDQFDLLCRYRRQYTEQLAESAQQRGLDHTAWMNYQSFLAQIDLAILQQRQKLEASRRVTEEVQVHWQSEKRYLNSLHTLAQRRDRAEEVRAARITQKESDAHALRPYQTRQA